MRAAAPVALVHSACIGDLLKSSFANYIASPAGAPAIWPFPFAVWYAVSAAAAISSGASVVEQRFSSSSSAGGSYPSTKERSIILSSASVCTNSVLQRRWWRSHQGDCWADAATKLLVPVFCLAITLSNFLLFVRPDMYC
ncbi:uncharacterized protein [Triticum aestivum]|uniref:uncharacterized protein n=1 Tax=Triticum aestivum TaxID=4565 RepID=UPI00098A9FC8|nr:uncharacterized protein LOC109774493 isoform X2 [Aegilops tauschii subsp. strangulata]XP_044443179.1 uncharacterized protein LOC123169406 [Triticum aestivum]